MNTPLQKNRAFVAGAQSVGAPDISAIFAPRARANPTLGSFRGQGSGRVGRGRGELNEKKMIPAEPKKAL